MKSQEMVIRMVQKLDGKYGEQLNLNQGELRTMLEDVVYDYNVSVKETALAINDDIPNMILLYLATRKTEGLTDSTLKSYGRGLGRFADEIHMNVIDITAMDIRMYLAQYGKTGVKNTTIATHTDILRGFFNWLEDEEYVSKSPMKKIKSIKVEKRLGKALTKKELELLKGGAKTLREKALLALFYSTGSRLSEIVNMKKSDIDWQTLQAKVIGKGNKERVVYINAEAQVHLRRYLKSRTDDCDSIFITERKPLKGMSNRAIQRAIDKIHEQSELKKNVHPHLLRHSVATHLLNSGMNITVLQEILGHSSPDTTLIYAQNSNSTVASEYRKYS